MAQYATAMPNCPAAGTFRLEQDHWATSYKDKPLASVVIGYRLPGEADLQWALDKVREWTNDKTTDGERNRATIKATVAACVCDVRDASKAHEAFPCPEDDIPNQLRPEVIQAIFDEIERAMLESSPTRLEIDDGEVVELVDLLLGDGIEALNTRDHAKACRIKRLLKFCLEELALPEEVTG